MIYFSKPITIKSQKSNLKLKWNPRIQKVNKEIKTKKEGCLVSIGFWYPRNKMAAVALRSSTHALWLARYMHPFQKTITHTNHLHLLRKLHCYNYFYLLINVHQTLCTRNHFHVKKKHCILRASIVSCTATSIRPLPFSLNESHAPFPLEYLTCEQI